MTAVAVTRPRSRLGPGARRARRRCSFAGVKRIGACASCHGTCGDGQDRRQISEPRPRLHVGCVSLPHDGVGKCRPMRIPSASSRRHPGTSMPSWKDAVTRRRDARSSPTCEPSPRCAGEAVVAPMVLKVSPRRRWRGLVELGRNSSPTRPAADARSATVKVVEATVRRRRRSSTIDRIRSPRSFMSVDLKGGSRAEDIVRALSTGLNGTPMPSWADALDERERWRRVRCALERDTSSTGYWRRSNASSFE